MSMAELTLLDNKGYKRTVTISPDKKLWEKFTELVETQYGKKRQSAVIGMIVNYFNENADYEFEVHFSNDPIIKVTLSVSIDIWEEFDEKVMKLFSKVKIKSSVVSSLIKQYINDHKNQHS